MADNKPPATPEQLIEMFQCPGCACGSNTSCGKYQLARGYGNYCESHVIGTQIGLGNRVAIGLPNGFNKPGLTNDRASTREKIDVRLWTAGTQPMWDELNVPVWALVEDGFLFVRTFMPRINQSTVDVVEGGTLEMVPGARDVSEFAELVN